MSVYVLPVYGAARARVWRAEGDSIVQIPVTPGSTTPEERLRRAQEVGDVCTEAERAAIFAAYEVANREEILASVADKCPVCAVPQSLRHPEIPYPKCPEHDL